MIFTSPLKLPIFFHTDSTRILQDTGVDYKLDDCETREMSFYQIAALSPYIDYDDDKKEYCRIHTNGDTFLCLFNVKEVEGLIDDHDIIIDNKV